MGSAFQQNKLFYTWGWNALPPLPDDVAPAAKKAATEGGRRLSIPVSQVVGGEDDATGADGAAAEGDGARCCHPPRPAGWILGSLLLAAVSATSERGQRGRFGATAPPPERRRGRWPPRRLGARPKCSVYPSLLGMSSPARSARYGAGATLLGDGVRPPQVGLGIGVHRSRPPAHRSCGRCNERLRFFFAGPAGPQRLSVSCLGTCLPPVNSRGARETSMWGGEVAR